LLYVRERAGSAYMTMAHDPARFRPCLDAIHRIPQVRARFMPQELASLRRKAEAENEWVIGRELIRHRFHGEGRAWLSRSLRTEPSVKRFGMLGLSWLGVGPFRPYAASASTSRRGTAWTGIAA
jgi:hypothetical protein